MHGIGHKGEGRELKPTQFWYLGENTLKMAAQRSMCGMQGTLPSCMSVCGVEAH